MNRIEDFELFQSSVNKQFKIIENQLADYQKLEDYYGFSICPKGRVGGIDGRRIEIFYGNRPYDKRKIISDDMNIRTELLSESGAELSVFRDDFGFACIQLYPAESKFGKQREESILVNCHLDPKRLLKHRFQKHMMLILNSYMAVTCLEGNPTPCDKLHVFLLRTFKPTVVEKRVQPARIWPLINSIVKFVLTVGLSGFLLKIIDSYV